MTSAEGKQTQNAQRAAALAALMATFLAIGKLTLYWASGSLVVAISAWDSCMDGIVSLINRKIIHFARQSADSEHPYGHGKAESIAAFGQGSLILGGALIIFVSSLQKLFLHLTKGNTETNIETWFGVAFFILSALISILITKGLHTFGTRYQSPALLADAQHYRMDVISNLASAISVACILISKKPWLDPLLAGIFSIYIAFGGYKLLKESANDLMDSDLPDELKKQVLSIIESSCTQIIDVHKFRGRRSGHRYFFDFHVTLPTTLEFSQVHVIVEHIEEKLLAQFDADVVIHADPDSLTGVDPLSVVMSRRP